eukprot:3521687-Rhodomonas_salina.2
MLVTQNAVSVRKWRSGGTGGQDAEPAVSCPVLLASRPRARPCQPSSRKFQANSHADLTAGGSNAAPCTCTVFRGHH